MIEEKTKVCSKCKNELPLSRFYKDRRAKDGLTSSCKGCNNVKIIRPIPKEGHKFCHTCKEEKPLSEFYKDKHHPTGRCPHCKVCRQAENLANRITRELDKPKLKEGHKFCSKCGEEKPLNKFYKDVSAKAGVTSQCKECVLGHPEKQKPNGWVNIDPYSPLNFRVCKGCGELLPITRFTISKIGKDGKPHFKCKCKPCQNEITAAFYQEHKEDILHGKLLKRRENPHLDRERIAKRRAADPEGEFAKDREYRQNNLDKTAASAAKRRAAKLQAMPEWFEEDKIKALFFESAELTKYILSTEVDHIVPLQSDLVCGLHCIDNLRIIPELENTSKGNRFWDDMWAYEDYIEDTANLVRYYK